MRIFQRRNSSSFKRCVRLYFISSSSLSLISLLASDLWTKNMYLAEDRILCWELVSKRDSAWVLHYERSAYAVTDVPDTVADLISQRRRWLNGSFFAGIHSS